MGIFVVLGAKSKSFHMLRFIVFIGLSYEVGYCSYVSLVSGRQLLRAYPQITVLKFSLSNFQITKQTFNGFGTLRLMAFLNEL